MVNPIKKIILFLILNFSIFAIKIDSLNFDKKIPLGDSVEKIFTIENNDNIPKRYIFSIEEADKHKNIEVYPKTFIILPNKSKAFFVKVKGEKKGKNNYILIIEDEALKLSNQNTDIKINLKYRIEQKYFVM